MALLIGGCLEIGVYHKPQFKLRKNGYPHLNKYWVFSS